jgi:hypothetical protein
LNCGLNLIMVSCIKRLLCPVCNVAKFSTETAGDDAVAPYFLSTPQFPNCFQYVRYILVEAPAPAAASNLVIHDIARYKSASQLTSPSKCSFHFLLLECLHCSYLPSELSGSSTANIFLTASFISLAQKMIVEAEKTFK